MGVDITHYVIYGAKFEYDEFFKHISYEEAEPYIEGRPGYEISIVADAMCGEYVVIGKVLSACDPYGDGSNFTELKIDELWSEGWLKEQIWNVLPNLETPLDVKLFIFAHAS